MKLLNRGKREIHGETHVNFTTDEAGVRTYERDAEGQEIKPVPFVMKPNTAIDFDETTGARLKRLFTRELVTFEDLQRQFDGSTLVAANAPVPSKAHQNVPPAAPATPPVPSHSDLSEEEQLFIARMRAERAKPPATPAEGDQSPAPAADATDPTAGMSEAELEAATAPGKTGGLMGKVAAALHRGA